MATAKDKLLHLLAEALCDGSFVKLTLGAHCGSDRSLRQLFARRAQLRRGPRLSFVWRHTTRDVTKNLPDDEAITLLANLVGREFRSAHLFTTRLTAQLEFRKGRTARLVESEPVHTKLRSELTSPESHSMAESGSSTRLMRTS